MKNLLLILLLSIGWPWLTRVRDHNAAQAQGQAALRAGRPQEAAYLLAGAAALAGRGGPSPALLLDLAQAQALAGQPDEARATYARLLGPAVPPVAGSLARQHLATLLARRGQVAQALGLLRQAIRLYPGNAAARYNFELLSEYLAPESPASPPPAGGAAPDKPAPKPEAAPDSASSRPASGGQQPAPRPGGRQPGEAATTGPPPPAGGTDAPQPAANGQPDPQRPTSGSGGGANGSFRPGQGEKQPLPTGPAGGTRRGLDPGAGASGAAAPGAHRPGLEEAGAADTQLQTQRERLRAMNLTPAQAEQLLEALRESEQQYLQQRTRPRQGAAPAPGQPTW